MLGISFTVEPHEVQGSTAEKRNNNTYHGDDKGGNTGFLQLLQIGSQTRREHQHDNTDFRKNGNDTVFRNKVQNGRSENEACEQCAYNLRHVDFAGSKAQHLRGKKDNCQNQQESIVFHSLHLL